MTAQPQSRAIVEKPILARHAIVGIIAVSLAAMNSTLGAGLISTGLEDLRGAWKLGIDDAAYVPTAFNAAQMFMGPVSIMLAAQHGHRRVLLYAGIVYALASLVLPLVPHIVPTTMLIVISGLASGTFYPLCLSFITRNLPLSLVTFGIAAYNFDLLATNHLVQALEGFYMDHADWRWLFWNQAVFSIPMLFCVYIGIPPTPKEQLLPRFSYSGIFYVSGALSLFYIALDQGERLDWYNNGLINGLLIAGTLLFFAAIMRRRLKPNPWLDFDSLRKRNILLAGFMMLAFRTLLIRIGFLIPLFLETLHQYRTTETGYLFMLSLIPFAIAMPATAWLLNRMHARNVMVIGLVIVALINFRDAHILSTWDRNDFVVTQMVGAIGICMVSMATIAAIVFLGRMTGAYKNRGGAYAQGAFFQAVRLFASVASVSAFRRYLLFREHFWQTKLVSGLQTTWPFDGRAAYLGTALAPQASGPLQAREIGTGLIAKSVQAQSFTLAMDDTFMLLALVSVVALVAVSMMEKVPLPRELPDATA